MNTKVDEGKLISGKEALIALANGESVQKRSDSWAGDHWVDISKKEPFNLECFLSGLNRNGETIKFRLKPRTITINGIEAPSIKKESAIYRSNDTVAIVCESFEEAELMCLALRQVFGGSHDN